MLVAVVIAALIVFAGLALAVRGAVVVAQSRAEAAADAAAHAAVSYLATDARREALSVEGQLGQADCLIDSTHTTQHDDPGNTDTARSANNLCHDVLGVATAASDANGHAAIVAFDVSPDTRDYTSAGGAGRLVVLVSVQLAGPLAPYASFCHGISDSANQGLCTTVAWSAAQESG